MCLCEAKLLPPPDMWQQAGLESMLSFIGHAIKNGEFKPDPLVPVQIAPNQEVIALVRSRYLRSL